MKVLKEKTKINPKQVITIFNILRSIGLNTSHRGTKYINKAIQIITMIYMKKLPKYMAI